MPGLPPYQDVGGGGPNPPAGTGFFDRIINVHWRKKGVPLAGGVFIAADVNSNVYFMRFGEKSQSDETGIPEWTSLGTLGFGFTEGSVGWINGCSYGLVGGTDPVFVIVGGGGIYSADGIAQPATAAIMASRDGLNWSKVFSFGSTGGTATGASVFAVVWDGSAFWAAGHQSDDFDDFDEGGDTIWHHETDILFTSPDGFSWGEAGRVVLNYKSGATGFPDGQGWPPYNTGLLDPHCSHQLVDEYYGNGIPDGFYDFDEDTKVRISPQRLPNVDYLFGSCNTFFSEEITGIDVQYGGLALGIPGVGIQAFCAATAGGTWLVGGGTNYDIGQVVLLRPSVEAGGYQWVDASPSGAGAIMTMCGGQALAPPV